MLIHLLHLHQMFKDCPKWDGDTVDADGPMAGDPLDSRHTHAQKSSTRLLSHAISDDPYSFS